MAQLINNFAKENHNTSNEAYVNKTEFLKKEDHTLKLFEVSIDPACVASFDGYFKLVNPAFTKILGHSEKTLVSKPYIEFVHPEDIEATLAEAQKLSDLSIRTVGFINRLRKKDGSYAIFQWNVVPDMKAKLLYCSAKDITRKMAALEEKEKAIENLNLVIDGMSSGIWIFDIERDNCWWSDELYILLGLKKNQHLSSYSAFLQLIHKDDKENFVEEINQHFIHRNAYKIEVRMKVRDIGYQWMELSGMSTWSADGRPLRMSGSVINIHNKKSLREELEKQQFLLKAAGEMGKIGGWTYDPFTGKVDWTEQMYRIHELDISFVPTFENSMVFFDAESEERLRIAVTEALNHQRAYDLELKMNTATSRNIWVRAIGEPVVNDQGKTIKLRGVFQDIDELKNRENVNKESLMIIQKQNERLLNFAYIVSHNLRSHISNFDNLIKLHKNVKNEHTKKQAFAQIELSFLRLKETIDHLVEIVKIQTDINKQKSVFSFKSETEKVLDILKSDIEEYQAEIHMDFLACPNIHYVGAYLQSILLNLISNAMKYRHPERKPIIKLYSYKEDDFSVLKISDNGRGIDLEKYREKLFGMYKTFHGNQDARGIGLFIVKSQIEALGGKISVESKVNEGTTFKVVFENE